MAQAGPVGGGDPPEMDAREYEEPLVDATLCDSILASFPCGVCAVDRDGRIRYANPALRALLGWQQSDRRGERLAEYLEHTILDPAQKLLWTVALSQALDRGETTNLGLETQFLISADDRQVVSATGIAAPWREGSEDLGALLVFHDSAWCENLEAVRQRFLSVIAHELGSPATNLAAAIDLLVEHLANGNAELSKLLDIAQMEIKRLQRMLVSFLSPPSLRTEAAQLSRNVVTLAPLMRTVVRAFQARKSEHDFAMEVPRELPFVWGDAERIQEILSNLVDNAIKYSPPGTRIILSAATWQEDVVVGVTDFGPGIPPGDEERVFQPYHRGAGADEGEGEGLGLYIARTVVQALGGELWYERKPEGESGFYFSLHAVQAGQGTEEEGQDDKG
jgi:two-component system phosphate regulon sensor histidine kinase PhoR